MIRTTKYPNIIGESMVIEGKKRRVDNIAAVLNNFFNKKYLGKSWFDMSDEGNPYVMLLPLSDWIEENISLTETDLNKIKKIKSELKSNIPSSLLSEIPKNRPWTFKLGVVVGELLEYLTYPMDSTFKVGGFTIRTKGDPKVEEVLKCIDSLSKIPFFDDFKKVLYGDILISEEDDIKWDRIKEMNNWVAYYDRKKDEVRIRTEQTKQCNKFLLRTLIHELAHRYYHKYMGDWVKDAWKKYDKQVRESGGVAEINVGDKLSNLFILIDKNYNFSISEKPDSASETVNLIVREVEGDDFWVDVDEKSLSNPIVSPQLKMMTKLDPRALGPFSVSKYGQVSGGLYPSIYAQTNAEEHFCETLSYYYMGELEEEIAKNFKGVMNMGFGRKKVIASSQASWSILSEGCSSARVEAHIVRNHTNQMIEAIKKHPKLAELIYKLCGDNFNAIPKHLSKLERSLDRTNYALISMGGEWYRQRLTHEDREKVDMASKYNPTPFPSMNKQSTVQRVAMRFLDDFIQEHIDDLITLDPEFDYDYDSRLSRKKTEAIWSGDFDEAIKLTKNRRAKDYIYFMRDKYTVKSENLF